VICTSPIYLLPYKEVRCFLFWSSRSLYGESQSRPVIGSCGDGLERGWLKRYEICINTKTVALAANVTAEGGASDELFYK